MAGLDVIRIINEPTAACLAYGLDRAAATGPGKMRIMVFSFGGGTHDVTTMEIEGETYKVLATSGDTQTGGRRHRQRHRPAPREPVLQRDGGQPPGEPARDGEAEGGGREGQDRALKRADGGGGCAVPSHRRRRPEAPEVRAHPGGARADSPAHSEEGRHDHQDGPHRLQARRPRTSTSSSSSAARPRCPWSGGSSRNTWERPPRRASTRCSALR